MPPRPPIALVPAPADGDAPGDDALMAMTAAGNRAAFDALVRRHEARVRAYCQALVRDRHVAEELAQETFVKVWQAREKYRPDGRFRELLFTVARNACRSTQRREAVRALFGLREAVDEPAPTASGLLDEAERDRLVREALARLPVKFREPLLLRFHENMTSEEIARVIGRTPSAARSRIHYGLKELADLLPLEALR